MSSNTRYPTVVIGGGPVGLAAAAHLIVRGERPLILEADQAPGAAVRRWGHVRWFTPWKYLIDAAALSLLEETGWVMPDPEQVPTGRQIHDAYLAPLAAVPPIAEALKLGARVVHVTRRGVDKAVTAGRSAHPFEVWVEHADGARECLLASSVIDASGTSRSPNPLGANGLPAPGEAALAPRVDYGMPDVLGGARSGYAGRRVAVVGAGHSAFNVLLDLAKLPDAEAADVTWIIRKQDPGPLFGGGDADQLHERGRLGARMRSLAESGRLTIVAGFRTVALAEEADGVRIESVDGRTVGPFDRIVAATGFRPDLDVTRELRISLDPVVEAPPRLAPLIDPNVHSCGTVPPHGHRELAHPEPGFYTVGMKSYGRAPTFLLLTGYEQVRSVTAALTGDLAAADDVRLVLPETGVCSTDAADGGSAAAASCCGPAAQPVLHRLVPLA